MSVMSNSSADGDYKPFFRPMGQKWVMTYKEFVEGSEERLITKDDGTTESRFDVKANQAEGRIINVDIVKGKFNTSLEITMENSGEEVLLKIPVGARRDYFTSFAERFRGVTDPNSYVILKPYSMTIEGKEHPKVGISIFIDKVAKGESLKNFYWDGKKSSNGVPEIDPKNPPEDGDDWTIYFKTKEKFFKKEVLNHGSIFTKESQEDSTPKKSAKKPAKKAVAESTKESSEELF